ncbi:MAG: hypothetical protein IJZ79_02680 [Bacilli bacterium]|nr:hypothetical protein [Bacilli bacterium]MBQ8218630.1 hypothetical protein [Bacilli bacterium]
MALADFIQSLQEQDTVYSTPPQPSIRVIPPENQSIKVIPPETLAVEQPAPKVIKLKIKPKTEQPVVQQPTIETPVLSKPVSNTILQPVSKNNDAPVVTAQPQETIPKYVPTPAPTPQPKLQPVSTQPVQHPTVKTQVAQQPQPEYIPQTETKPTQMTDEDIFNSTGTEYSKKSIWLEYFEKAKTSRKSNPIVDRMRVGRFTITPDNKVLLLPDYDIVGKDPDDVLKDKWF